MYDFFAAVTSSWWLAAVPRSTVPREIARARRYFERHGLRRITDDVIIAAGRKPA